MKNVFWIFLIESDLMNQVVHKWTAKESIRLIRQNDPKKHWLKTLNHRVQTIYQHRDWSTFMNELWIFVLHKRWRWRTHIFPLTKWKNFVQWMFLNSFSKFEIISSNVFITKKLLNDLCLQQHRLAELSSVHCTILFYKFDSFW